MYAAGRYARSVGSPATTVGAEGLLSAEAIGVGEDELVGRAEELAHVAAGLEGRGCVIAGTAGVGKSRLAAEAAARRGAPVLRAVATGAAASVPFGAFAHLLEGVHVDQRGPIPAFIDAVRSASPSVPPTLIVDDAQLLDGASAALLLAVCESGAARVLVTIRRGDPAPDAVTGLWKDRVVGRLELEPLSRRELRMLVEARLGGPAVADVHTRVFALTEGNPLYARELLVDARHSGALVPAGGWWKWSGRQPRFERLADLIAARTRDLSAGGRHALELLAVAGPMELDVLTDAGGEAGVAALEHTGLAVVRGDPEAPTVDVAHPLFAEVTLAALPAAVARRHRRNLASILEARPHDDALHLLRLATLKLESGASDPELFLRAGSYALRLQAGVPGPGWSDGDATLAIRLADAAAPCLDAALLAARGRLTLGRFDDVERHLAPLEGAAAKAPFDRAADYLRSRARALHWSGNGSAAALALLERAQPWAEGADWAAVRATQRAWILHDLGRPATAARAVEAAVRAAGLAPAVRLDALLVLALVLSRLGLTDRCDALAPEIERLARELDRAGFQTGWTVYAVDAFARAEAARDLDAVQERLRQARARADARGDVQLAAGLAMALGRLALTRGHARAAIALLRDAIAGLGSGDPANALGWALCHLARAHALAGGPAAAEGALSRADAIATARPDHLRLGWEIERVRAWHEAARGRLSAARDRLLAVASGAGEALAFEAEITYDALRFGAPAQLCAEHLHALSARAQSPLLDACAEHAGAVAAGDPHEQLRAAERFAELGLDLPAAEAAAGAARAFAERGLSSSARAAKTFSRAHAALCQGVSTPVLALTPAVEQLTAREREVAALAAAGRTNAEIAGELVLSVRTVETYVLRACRKLGVKARVELGPSLGADGDP